MAGLWSSLVAAFLYASPFLAGLFLVVLFARALSALFALRSEPRERPPWSVPASTSSSEERKQRAYAPQTLRGNSTNALRCLRSCTVQNRHHFNLLAHRTQIDPDGLWFSVPSQALQVFPLFAAAHVIELALRLLAGGGFPGFSMILAPVLEALLWPVVSVATSLSPVPGTAARIFAISSPL